MSSRFGLGLPLGSVTSSLVEGLELGLEAWTDPESDTNLVLGLNWK